MKPLLASALLASGCLLFPVDDVVPTKHPECEDIHPDAVNVAKWKTRTIIEPFEDAGDACTVEECRGRLWMRTATLRMGARRMGRRDGRRIVESRSGASGA